MNDSPDIFGEEPPVASAAELEAAGQAAMFGNPAPASRVEEPRAEPVAAPAAPAAKPAAAPQPYRVLARKYRPQTFSELIGQDAMVQTLGNGIRRERLAHAFLMTGVRGVGKTSTARLIAKALNCIGPDGSGGPTIDPCGSCEPCVAIAEGRHIDVIEMDAASHTGIDDVREITEAVRYAAVSARYKIYIIDEVHMLSRQAFNGLLKTLEEPPPHVKFLFATTEADKLPVTVLSRCQRFDLRRIPAELLAEHFARICEAEAVHAEPEALALVAEAAEGSVRDGLSILDQAIAHADLDGAGEVTAVRLRDMLGLADRSVQRHLFAALLGGDGARLLEMVRAQFALGVEPVALLRATMELTHKVTVAQLGQAPSGAATEERRVIDDWAARLSPGQLHRLWQLLLKGHDEVRAAPDPLVAVEMALLRCLHAADLPDPGTLARRLEELAAQGAMAPTAPSGGAALAEPAASAPAPDWARLVAQVDAHHVRLGQVMRDWIQVIELAPGLLRYRFAAGYSEDCRRDLAKVLGEVTGREWQVEPSEGPAQPTLRERAEAEVVAARSALRDDPLVAAAFAAFPKAELIEAEAQPGPHKWSQSA